MIMFIDMNSFFASCEQQVNFWLRGRPVGVCTYTGKYGCIIAPSIEAKKNGVKTGMRLNDAIQICPDLVPLETHPNRYREYHIKIMNILRQYSEDVIPKSIDEAIIDLTAYKLIYKNLADLEKLARQIKKDIREKVGDWLRCSIGIAPNAFLAKLGSDIQKPDGLIVIMPENIDAVLSKLKLVDLPGIGNGMSERLMNAGIYTPLQLRHTKPDFLRAACKSVVGFYWYQRLNFQEVEIDTHNEGYKSMQAMRQVSAEKRKSVENLHQLLISLCMTLEKRMVRNGVFCCDLGFYTSYEERTWKDHVHLQKPVQDGMELVNIIKTRMHNFETKNHSGPIINTGVKAMCVYVSRFVSDDALQYHLFENNITKDKLRKIIYDVKNKYGLDKIMKAAELSESPAMRDAIGFGSVKDLHGDKSVAEQMEELGMDSSKIDLSNF
ncbi:MAG: DNA polymerase IV [Cytophagales bacterium]|jgi:DNA polymerase-4|nr:DNA polymerase IV [Bacteroidota bacterium]MBS1980300.1 DNA polymerase IV [Bacteroidota bacterium]WHZ08826.1 MAG: DNA polymerase IV [Cytophagales bacterium]